MAGFVFFLHRLRERIYHCFRIRITLEAGKDVNQPRFCRIKSNFGKIEEGSLVVANSDALEYREPN